jgi:rhomboid family GlyGly-CTERM serine protease
MRTRGWLAAVALSCIAIHLLPATHEWLTYDRAAIRNGEWWRLLTCHLVHFSTRHLLHNLAAFVVISGLLVKIEGGPKPFLLILGMLFVSFGLLRLRPAMAFYAGLSGIVSLLVWQFALNGFRSIPKHRTFFAFLLLALAGKLAFEFASGNSLAISFDYPAVIESMAHFLGALFAITCALLPNRHILKCHPLAQDRSRPKASSKHNHSFLASV